MSKVRVWPAAGGPRDRGGSRRCRPSPRTRSRSASSRTSRATSPPRRWSRSTRSSSRPTRSTRRAASPAGRSSSWSTTPSPTTCATRSSCAACCRRTRWTWSSPASPRPRARPTGRSSTSSTASPSTTTSTKAASATRNMIVTGAVPEQQFSTLIPWMMEKYGKNVYTIAADYNFGQISAEWVRNIVKENGGDDGRRGVHPARRVAVQPDHPEHPGGQARLRRHAARRRGAVVLLRAGRPRPTRRCRWPRRSTSARATSTSASRRRASRTCTSRPTTSRRSTRPTSKAFVEKFHAKFPNEPYINQEAANSYIAAQPLQADGGAGGVDRRATHRARSLDEGDVCFDGPVGQCLPRPEEPAHVAHDLPRACQRRPFDRLPEGLGGHQALLARRSRLRSDQERSVGAVHAVRSAAQAELIAAHAGGGRNRGRLPSAPASWRPMVAPCSRFQLLYQFGDAFAFLVICGERACGHLRHDGHHQSRAWRVHHVRAPTRRSSPRRAGLPLAARHRRGRAVRRARRHGARAAGDPAPLPPAARYDRRHLGHQPDRHAGHADPARLEHAGIATPFGSVTIGSLFLLDLPVRPVRRPRSILCSRSTCSSTAPASACSRGRRSSFRTWRGPRRQHAAGLQPDLRHRRGARRARRRALRADHDAWSRRSGAPSSSKLRHRRDRRRRHLRRHRAGRRRSSRRSRRR